MAVAGLTWLQLSPDVLTVTPAGGLLEDPAKLGGPPLAWFPLTATEIGSGVTVTEPGLYVMV